MSFSTFIKDDPVSYAKGGSEGSTEAPFLTEFDELVITAEQILLEHEI